MELATVWGAIVGAALVVGIGVYAALRGVGAAIAWAWRYRGQQ